MCNDKVDNKVNEYNSTYHSTIKMKTLDEKSRTYIDFDVENNEEVKIEVGDHVRISKYKSIFEKKLPFKLVRRSIVPWTYVIEDLNEA